MTNPRCGEYFVYLRVSLAALSFESEEASTGEQAALAEAHANDLVLPDVEMPGMGGIETCRELRVMIPKSAVVTLTVRTDKEDRATALEAGAVDYLITKHYRPGDPVARIRLLLNS